MGKITAFMIVRNEELLLPACIAAIEGSVDRVAVLDTGSEDGTIDFLRETAASGRFESFRWDEAEFTDFGSAQQAALDMVETEWALWLGADETVSPELSARLAAMRSEGGLESRDAWELHRVNRVLGRVMKGRNLSGQYALRLFRAEKGRITRSLVHEGVEMDPGCTLGRLEEPLYHDTMTSWRLYLKKVDLYTTLDVRASERGFNPLHMMFTGLSAFWRQYVARTGIRDGWPGFVWAATSAWSATLRDWKLMKRALRRRLKVLRESRGA